MGIFEITNMQSQNYTKNVKQSIVEGSEDNAFFSKLLSDKRKKCPYNHLAKDGLIEYNGVTFVCNYKTNSICLGDMSNPREVLNISLPSGGNLKVNINNIDDLAKATGMFSPADLNAIMRAIAQYNHCTSKRNELDENEEKTVEDIIDESTKHVEKQGDYKEEQVGYREYAVFQDQLRVKKDY